MRTAEGVMTAQRSGYEEPVTISTPPVELGPLHAAAACPAYTGGTPMDHTSEAPAITALERRGFTAQFAAHRRDLRVTHTGLRFRPEDVRIRDYYRFEGTSDPDDMSVVYALEARDGTRGVLVDAFGSYADPAVGAMVNRMRVDTPTANTCALSPFSRSTLALLALGAALVGVALAWIGAARWTGTDTPRRAGGHTARRAA
jgi:hypothetical protein